MTLFQDIQTLYHMARGNGRGNSHAERLENFYGPQAKAYDDFRKRLLHGRKSLYQQLPVPENGIWIDMGGGTGANLEALGTGIFRLQKIYLVDLCSSLLKVARERIAQNGWSNVVVVETDAAGFTPREGAADVITFSYSLTMMPDWEKALHQACRILAPGGYLGVVDFYVSPNSRTLSLPRHCRLYRQFWRRWFSRDGVMLNPKHVVTLCNTFEMHHLAGFTSKVPYLPFIRVPWYRFVGRKPCSLPYTGRESPANNI